MAEEHELFAKGALGILITGTAVVAFVASNLYVLALSIGLHQNLATCFEILDFVQITPAWGLPVFTMYVCTWVVYSFLVTTPIKSKGWRLITFIAIGALLILSGVWIGLRISKTAASFFLHFVYWWLVGCSVSFFVFRGLDKLRSEYEAQPAESKGVMPILFALVSGGLAFTFLYGLANGPTLVRAAPVTTVWLTEELPKVEGRINVPGTETNVTFEREKDEVKGRIVFKLSHSLLLLTAQKSLVVIPDEKIKRIETPRSRFSDFWISKPTPEKTIDAKKPDGER